MIDRKKIIHELEELKSGYPEGSIEEILLTGFLKYIAGQPKISERECLFRLRMRRVAGVLERRGAI